MRPSFFGCDPDYAARSIISLGPPCYPLLTDAYATLTNKSTWPAHLCLKLLTQSTEDWIAQRQVANRDALMLWRETWPLPIGQRAMLYDSPNWKLLVPKSFKVMFSAAFGQAVFPGLEYAFLALSIPVEAADAIVDLFGLATPHRSALQLKHDLLYASTAKSPSPTWGGGIRRGSREEVDTMEALFTSPRAHEEFYKIGPLAWRIVGKDPTHEAVLTLIKRTKRWWSQFEGRPLSGSIYAGRPKGSGYFSNTQEFMQMTTTVVRTLRNQGRKVTQESVAEYFSQHSSPYPKCDSRQIRQWCKSFGLTWRDLLNAVAD